MPVDAFSRLALGSATVKAVRLVAGGALVPLAPC